MDRLISANALKEYIDVQKGRPFIGCTIGEAFKIMTDEQPTVDAIPISWLEDLHKTAQSEEADMMIDEIISLWEARGNEIS